MAGTGTVVVKLSELEHGQEAVCFAALVKKERGVDKHDRPFLKCHFRDRWKTVVAPFWANNALREEAETWEERRAYRLRVRGEHNVKFGFQIDVLQGRLAREDDAAEGYRFNELVESSDKDPEALIATLFKLIDKYILEPPLKELVLTLIRDNSDLFKKMPAAQNFHHSYTAGLLEHVWSMARIAAFLADHYDQYYDNLNPPLNKGVILAAVLLHDIGKLRELEYDPVEARYTKEGSLIGHVVIGRDLARDAAKRIEGFPEETLRLLEHAILSHHGKKEFGAPVLPLTLEALLVSYIDEIDAKMNIAARERLLSQTECDFTDPVFALDRRRIYKGVPLEATEADDLGEIP
jgi:3'-5' exoribonuclease